MASELLFAGRLTLQHHHASPHAACACSQSGSPLPVGVATPAEAAGLPNSAAQRKDMIDLLKKLNVTMSEMNTQFKSGKARVRVEAGAKK